jgi:hypothetical protein
MLSSEFQYVYEDVMKPKHTVKSLVETFDGVLARIRTETESAECKRECSQELSSVLDGWLRSGQAARVLLERAIPVMKEVHQELASRIECTGGVDASGWKVILKSGDSFGLQLHYDCHGIYATLSSFGGAGSSQIVIGSVANQPSSAQEHWQSFLETLESFLYCIAYGIVLRERSTERGRNSPKGEASE